MVIFINDEDITFLVTKMKDEYKTPKFIYKVLMRWGQYAVDKAYFKKDMHSIYKINKSIEKYINNGKSPKKIDVGSLERLIASIGYSLNAAIEHANKEVNIGDNEESAGLYSFIEAAYNEDISKAMFEYQDSLTEKAEYMSGIQDLVNYFYNLHKFVNEVNGIPKSIVNTVNKEMQYLIEMKEKDKDLFDFPGPVMVLVDK